MESIWIYSYQMQAVEAMRRSREADEAEIFLEKWRDIPGGTWLKKHHEDEEKCVQPGRKLQHFFTFDFFWVEIECIDTIRWNAVWIARGFKVTLCSTFVVGGHLTFKRVTWTIWSARCFSVVDTFSWPNCARCWPKSRSMDARWLNWPVRWWPCFPWWQLHPFPICQGLRPPNGSTS